LRGPLVPSFVVRQLGMELKTKIEEIIKTLIGETDLFIVEIRVSSSAANMKISVLLDGDKGITIEDCAQVSRKLGHIIETENLIETAYLLEVSSPGADAPLKLHRQYVKNKGRRLSVLLNDGSEKTGLLEEVKDALILLQSETKEKKKVIIVPVEIPFSEIKKSNVLISFK
jgi:ribosome maturation factor RimP